MSAPLAALAMPRSPQAAPPRRPVAGAIVVAAIALAALAAAAAAWQRLRPPLAVAAVAVAPGDGGQTPAAGVLARAAGWIRPDPAAVAIAARRAGTIAAIAVRPGQAVAAGDAIARLDPADAELARARAEAAVAQAAARHGQAQAAVAVAEARLAQAEAQERRLRGSGGAVSGGDLDLAAREVAARAAETALARAGLAEVAAGMRVAEAELGAAALDLERCAIVAPSAGVILRVAAAPGQRLSLDEPEAALIAELYDPARLHVRADVPIAEAGGLAPGLAAEIECDVLPGRVLSGRVAGIAGQADAARNAVPAFILIDDPPAQLRPDLLARVRILAPGGATETAPAQRPVGLLAPTAGLRGMAGGRATAWVIDHEQRLRRRAVVVAGSDRSGWTPVAEGLRLGEPVVIGPDDGLVEGRAARAAAPAAGGP